MRKSVRIAGIIIMVLFLSGLFGGCAKDELSSRDIPMPSTDIFPGTLEGVIREIYAGGMEYHTEFSIEVRRDGVVEATYWPKHGDIVTKQNFPVKQSQWSDLEKITAILFPLLKEVPDDLPDPDPEIQILDGDGAKDILMLIFSTDEGERSIRYYIPQDRRMETMDSILRNIAEGKNHKVVWYAAPEIVGIYFYDRDEGYSFQFTDWADQKNTYRFIAYSGNDALADVYVPDVIWDNTAEFVRTLNIEQFEESYGDSIRCTLYYSDDMQRSYKPDQKTMETLRSYFSDLVDTAKSNSK
ncbi:MAG: hypothetical protein IKE18_10295 [Oscillospiraceae bacterium]|nr:hypothetical protein [Oscillospiraceae bacterium]